jgi:transcriptional regulator with XRE-family HTH domain
MVVLHLKPTFCTMKDKSPGIILLADMGTRIRMARMVKGYTQIQLSLNCEIEKSTMSKIEAGKVNISYLMLHRLSLCLQVPMGDFCEKYI